MKVTTESLSKPAADEFPLTWNNIRDVPGVYLISLNPGARIIIGNCAFGFRAELFVGLGPAGADIEAVSTFVRDNYRFRRDPNPFRITVEN